MCAYDFIYIRFVFKLFKNDLYILLALFLLLLLIKLNCLQLY